MKCLQTQVLKYITSGRTLTLWAPLL